MLPLVSILIPAYNVENYIRQSIASVTTQTYPNIEIVIIVNNSTDSTYNICLELKEKDNRINVIDIGHCPSGIVGALNYGLKICSGDFIARTDADDIMHPERIEVQLKQLIKRNLDMIGVNVFYTYNGLDKIKPILSLPYEHIDMVKLYPYRNPMLHLWLAKKKVYQKLGGYRNIRYAEDYDFVGRAILYNFKIGNTKEILQTLLDRPNNTASVGYELQVNSQQMISTAFIKNNLLDNSFSKENKNIAPNRLVVLIKKYVVNRTARKILLVLFSRYYLISYKNAVIAKLLIMQMNKAESQR